MLKKVLSVILVSILLATSLFCFSGCGKKEESEDVTLHWYMQKPVGDMSRQEEVENEANEIIYEKLGVKLKFHFVEAAAWKDKLNVLLSSGGKYDIISTASTDFILNAKKNNFADLKSSLEKYGSSILEKSDDFAWDAVTFDGKIMGIPSQTNYVPYSAFAFKKDLVEKYNFDYEDASTYEDIEPFLKNIKENEKDVTGIAATMNGGVASPKFGGASMTTLDFIYFDHNTKEFKAKYFLDEVEKINRTQYDFAQKGYISKNAFSMTEPISEMKSGKYAVVNGRRSAEKSSNLYGFDCVEAKPTYGPITTLNVLNSVNAISANSKHVDKAIQLLNLIWEDSYLSNTLAYGIEGKDYTVDKGDVHNYKDIDEIHITTNSGTDVKWSIWHNWLGPLWDQWDSPWNSRESLKEMQQLNKTAERSPIIGFVIDTDNIRTEVAQLTSVCKDADQVFATGSMKDFDEFMKDTEKKLNQAGLEKVLKEINRQYKEWK